MSGRQDIRDGLAAIDMKIGRNLRALRQSRRMSQAELAGILGITFQQMQKYERGLNRLSASKLYRLKSHLDVPYEDFFAGLDGADYARQNRNDDLSLLLKKVRGLPDLVLRDKILRILEVLVS
ncbi:MAG: helix-turn-helix transcriptional regulator [Rhodospirillales bacterium]|nr:helix-turn-helix transcriptional regulator [Rhodospirillales bacterium]